MLSDSLSVLKPILNCKCDSPLLVDLFNLYLSLSVIIKTLFLPGFQGMLESGETMLLTWLLSMLCRSRRMAVPYSDFKVLTNMYIKKLWQTEWERYPGNKLYKIQPKVDDPIPSHG